MKLLAGEKGMNRSVKRVSVSDLKGSQSEKQYYNAGDLFISSLRNFDLNLDINEVEEFFDCLIDGKTAGLIFSCDEGQEDAVPQYIIDKCNDADYPLLAIESGTYAEIMATINKYLAFEDLTLSYKYTINEIRNKHLSTGDLNDITLQLFPGTEEYIAVICFEGDVSSDVMFADFIVKTLNSSTNVYAGGEGIKYYLIADKDPAAMKKRMATVKVMIKEYFNVIRIGESRVSKRWEIKQALDEAVNSYRMATWLKEDVVTYSPMSTYQLLSLVANSSEARAFYAEFKRKLADNCTEAHFEDMMDTLKTYIDCHGDYKATAEMCNQHENTIRYRINKIKSWLDLEEDTVQFHEVASIARKLAVLFDE